MNTDDTTTVSNLMADIMKCIQHLQVQSIMNGFTDAELGSAPG
jgi:hypothetical protein